jgi:hypothetical protein
MRLALAALLAVVALPACAANAPAPPPPPPNCNGPQFRQLDFWLGDWDAKWDPSPGDTGIGSNHIARSYEGCVIEEHFDGHPGQHLMGHSVSAYFAPTRDWRQTWVDNEGGYIDLTGGPQPNGDFVLTTLPKPSGKANRMVFTDIAPDSFTWRWQANTDGKTWTDSWVIHYTRKKAG